MKIYCATMIHESNSFSVIPTSIENFRESVLYRPSTGEGVQHLGQVLAGVDHLALAKKFGFEARVGLIANAEPSLPLTAECYAALRSEILHNLERVLPVDGVFLFLHGAQMADQEIDCESDVVGAIRTRVGRDIPIAVELDLHCNVGDRLLDTADIVLACLEYPHIDFGDRAERALRLLSRAIAGRIDPVTFIERIPALGLYPTTSGPMSEFLNGMKSMEDKEGVHAISLCQGFTGADNPDTSAGIMVVAEREELARARRFARHLADEFWRIRVDVSQKRVAAEEAIDQACALEDGPIVFADTSDNPGGGAAGDSTYFLQRFLERRPEGLALAMIWDPLAAEIAAKAGRGANLSIRLGGKSGPASCNPLDVQATVLEINPHASQMAQGARSPLGLTVALDIDGSVVVVNSIRQQTFSPECFTEVGVDPLRKHLLIVKSGQHFYETFSPFARHIVYADGPRGLPVDYMSFPYRRIRRPVWPLDPLPFEAYGRQWT